MARPDSTVFVLSPARCNGERARMLARSATPTGVRLRAGEAPVGDVMTWLSALYFRGKLAYARTFARPPRRAGPAILVMAPGLGLVPPEHPISGADLAAMGAVDVESEAFAGPLRRDAAALAARCEPRTRVVLLGSIATGKYVTSLLDVFATRLLFPACFVGRGDMSRGGLLLRASRTGVELDYTPIVGATLHGPRPPKLPRLPRTS